MRPWETTSVGPRLSVAPDLGVALGDSVVVAPAGGAGVADARVAVAGGGKSDIALEPATTREPVAVPELAVARARPVTRPASAPPSVKPPAPPSPAPPSQPQYPPTAPGVAPVSSPVPASGDAPAPSPAPPTRVVASHEGGPQGPVAGGVGPSEGAPAFAAPVEEGDEYAFSFSFYVQPSAYRMPGAENLIMRFQGEGGELPGFGLQLWDDGSGAGHGLWSSGAAMDGERFLAPLTDGAWHEVAVCFRASSGGDGFYLLFLDGEPIELRAGVSLIEPGSHGAQLELGLFRDGEGVEGSPEIVFGDVRLGDALEPVLP